MSGPENLTEEPRAERLVRCVRCDHHNPRSLTLCEKCGAHLYLLCHRCGTRNARVRSKCSECGHRLHRSSFSRLLGRVAGKVKALRARFNSRKSHERRRRRSRLLDRVLRKLFGNRLMRSVLGRNSKLAALQIVLLVVAILVGYKMIQYFGDFHGPVPEERE